jgi:hypothetical protein
LSRARLAKWAAMAGRIQTSKEDPEQRFEVLAKLGEG